MAQDYNATLNLPKTEFPMRAGLPAMEPGILQEWEENRLYDKMMERGEGKPKYVLHDGPPYANANIHTGTAMNKVLKDVIVRHKNMSGFQAPYVPGWDTHGLPIERKAIQELGITEKFSKVELREKCREFALHYVDIQKGQFKRLGTLGDYDHPYLTLHPEFEACQIEMFGTLAKKGFIYKGLKPVYWCTDCKTALAEAEIEYAEDPCDSIYVKFKVVDDKGKLTALGADLDKTYLVIWTTTTWTLPGNLAICLGPDYEYCLTKAGGEFYLMAAELAASTMKAAGITDYTLSEPIKGRELEFVTYRHPFLDRVSPVILGDHVTLESGTGCVHTAPGHGVEDFEVCARNYPDIPVIVPVDDKGFLTEEAGMFKGLKTEAANKVINKHLAETGALFALEHINHQYPHCWRCKEPVLFRATEQWFCSVEDFKPQVLAAIKNVQWIPEWGENKMAAMVENRSDWCISRQRSWGVPIPVFYCDDCGKHVVDDATIAAVAALFRKEGSDAWYKHEAGEILPAGYKCPHCGGGTFTKEEDIMDVWFDSGVTHMSVLTEERGQPWPADLYLEGIDQYRGWFQSSLLTAVAWKGEAPYKAVCSHGWVIDDEGKKMSKSLGNSIAPEDIIKDYGADLLRLWVCSSDYHNDVHISYDYLKQLSEGYRKIRNTARYILGNLSDFDPNTDSVPFADWQEIDKWAMANLQDLLARVEKAYNAFDFHLIYHAVHNFCTVDMSSFYLDVLKDRLYAEETAGIPRRAAQTAIYTILRGLTLAVAPILAYTAEEIWKYIPKDKNYDNSWIMLNDMPASREDLVDEAFMKKWNRIHAVRDDVNKALEIARGEKFIGKSLEAKVVLHCDGELFDFVTDVEALLPTVFIVSEVALVRGGQGTHTGEMEGLSVDIQRASGEKCERCWVYSETVGQNPQHPTICARCAAVLGAES